MCRDRPLCAAICRSLERKLLVFLGLVLSSQAEGRRFEPGLALQLKRTPIRALTRESMILLGVANGNFRPLDSDWTVISFR